MTSRFVRALATACAVTFVAAAPTTAQQRESKLVTTVKTGKLRVCQVPTYYGISFRNPKTNELEGIDVDLSKELAKELGARLEIVETGWVTFIADLQANKCDIGMFAVGALQRRAQAVEFSEPYLQSGVYAIVKKDSKLQNWSEIDQSGNRIAVTLGAFMEPYMKAHTKNAQINALTPPANGLSEVGAGRSDIYVTDYPAGMRIIKEFDWARLIAPTEPLGITPYAYVVSPGDQIWLNYINLFVRTIKLDGRLKAYAAKHDLGPIVAP
jgi:cyclohexadienyl dehydratase